MAKAKLTAAVSKWVDQKGSREKAQADNGKIKHTFYVSREASKRLWQERVNTGVPISRLIDDLVIKHLCA